MRSREGDETGDVITSAIGGLEEQLERGPRPVRARVDVVVVENKQQRRKSSRLGKPGIMTRLSAIGPSSGISNVILRPLAVFITLGLISLSTCEYWHI